MILIPILFHPLPRYQSIPDLLPTLTSSNNTHEGVQVPFKNRESKSFIMSSQPAPRPIFYILKHSPRIYLNILKHSFISSQPNRPHTSTPHAHQPNFFAL